MVSADVEVENVNVCLGIQVDLTNAEASPVPYFYVTMPASLMQAILGLDLSPYISSPNNMLFFQLLTCYSQPN